MTVVLDDQGGVTELDGELRNGDLWLSAEGTASTLGWTLRPEGFCKDDVCVPIDAAKRPDVEADGDLNVSALWRHMRKPVLSASDGNVWLFGEDAATRHSALSSGIAPDFELPDFDGQTHRLKDYRGQKVFLVSWASW